MKLDEREHWLF